MIMRPVKINKFVAEIFQNRQSRGRTVDELAIRSGRREGALQNQIVFARFDSGFDEVAD